MAAQAAGKVVKKGKWQVTMTPDDLYRNPMDIAWSFDYLVRQGQGRRPLQARQAEPVGLRRTAAVGHEGRSVEPADRRPIVRVPQDAVLLEAVEVAARDVHGAFDRAVAVAIPARRARRADDGGLRHAFRARHERQALCRDADDGRGASRRGLREVLRQDRHGLSDDAVAEDADRRDAEVRPLREGHDRHEHDRRGPGARRLQQHVSRHELPAAEGD